VSLVDSEHGDMERGDWLHRPNTGWAGAQQGELDRFEAERLHHHTDQCNRQHCQACDHEAVGELDDVLLVVAAEAQPVIGRRGDQQRGRDQRS
jgi:hypothetical protein